MTDPTDRSVPSSRRKLRVGIIVDGLEVTVHVRRLVEWVIAQPEFETPYLIVQRIDTSAGQATRRQAGPVSTRAMAAVRWLEARRLRRDPRYSGHLERHSLSDLGLPQLDVAPVSSFDTLVHRYQEADLVAVTDVGFDVLLLFGSGILQGPILSAARFGVIAFDHGNDRANRGMPPGFWEAAS